MTDFIVDLLMGGASGVIAKTICAPLERVKILLQTQAVSQSAHKPYTGILDAFQRIPKEEGMLAFWRGNFTNCARYFPTQAMNFAFKEKYQQLFVPKRDECSFARWFSGYLAAGGAAGATSLSVAYPLDFAYTRLAGDIGSGSQRQFTGLADCFTKIVKADGVRGLYRGFGPSVAGIVVYRAGYFGFYDIFKQLLFGEHSYSSLPLKLCLAFAVDVGSAMLSYPFDTIRRRMMMQSGRKAEDILYTNAFQCARRILQDEGFKGWYKGAGMNAFRAIASAMVLVLYDEIRYVVKGGVKKGGH